MIEVAPIQSKPCLGQTCGRDVVIPFEAVGDTENKNIYLAMLLAVRLISLSPPGKFLESVQADSSIKQCLF